MPRRIAAKCETRDAERGRNRSAQDPCVEGKKKDVPGSLKNVPTISKTRHQIGGRYRFETVTRADSQRSEHGACCRDVNKKCSRENSGPITRPKEKQRHDGNSRWRPKRTSAG